jgi:hypothetical protein
LFGLDAPQRLAVGISETEFAQQAVELLKVTGPGPLLELVRAAPIDGEVIAEAGESEPDGWSNIVPGPAHQPAAESPPEPEPQAEDDLEDGELEPDEPEPEVIVPLPAGARRIPAAQVLGRGYDPFRGVRW